MVGRLTLDSKSDEWAKSSVRFRQLYLSELSVVEDRAIEVAMVRFGNALQALHRDQRTQVGLQEASIDLAHALRKSIEESWRVQQ